MRTRDSIIAPRVVSIAGDAAHGAMPRATARWSAGTDGEAEPSPTRSHRAQSARRASRRTVTADADGNYRFPFLPVGDYTSKRRRTAQRSASCRCHGVSLGNATTVEPDARRADARRGQVIGYAHRHSGRRDLDRVGDQHHARGTRALPVERDLHVGRAARARRLTKGDNEFGGVSFGGSSVAENTVYINGLNVTDFYNRVGFSSVPYAFYKEFQVKTGGYSVEFGRTTGGVINAVTRSGTNEFEFGAEARAGSRVPAVRRRRPLRRRRRPLLSSRSHDEYDRTSLNVVRVGPDHPGPAVLLRACTRRATTSPTTPTTPAQLLRRRLGRRLLGRARSTGRSPTTTCWSCSRSPTRSTSDRGRLRVRPARPASAATYQSTQLRRQRRQQLGADLHGLPHRQFLREGDVRRERARTARSSPNDIDCNRVRDRARRSARRSAAARRPRSVIEAHRHARSGAPGLRMDARRPPAALRPGPRDQHVGALASSIPARTACSTKSSHCARRDARRTAASCRPA